MATTAVVYSTGIVLGIRQSRQLGYLEWQAGLLHVVILYVAALCSFFDLQAKLKGVEEKIAALESQYEEATAKKASLAQQVLRCTVQLQRADKLIGGLGGERVRWQVRLRENARFYSLGT